LGCFSRAVVIFKSRSKQWGPVPAIIMQAFTGVTVFAAGKEAAISVIAVSESLVTRGLVENDLERGEGRQGWCGQGK
jgi:hypothetical protein